MRLTLTIFFLLFMSSPVFAGFSFSEKTTYHNVNEPDPYKVLGKSVQTISKFCTGAPRAVGCAASSIKYSYKTERIGKNRCKINDFSFTLNVTYHIPKWVNARKSGAKYRKQWKSTSSEILKHEKRHGKISHQHYKNAYGKIKNLKSDCNRMEDKINERMLNATKRERKAQQKFHNRKGESVSPFPK